MQLLKTLLLLLFVLIGFSKTTQAQLNDAPNHWMYPSGLEWRWVGQLPANHLEIILINSDNPYHTYYLTAARNNDGGYDFYILDLAKCEEGWVKKTFFPPGYFDNSEQINPVTICRFYVDPDSSHFFALGKYKGQDAIFAPDKTPFEERFQDNAQWIDYANWEVYIPVKSTAKKDQVFYVDPLSSYSLYFDLRFFSLGFISVNSSSFREVSPKGVPITTDASNGMFQDIIFFSGNFSYAVKQRDRTSCESRYETVFLGTTKDGGTYIARQ